MPNFSIHWKPEMVKKPWKSWKRMKWTLLWLMSWCLWWMVSSYARMWSRISVPVTFLWLSCLPKAKPKIRWKACKWAQMIISRNHSRWLSWLRRYRIWCVPAGVCLNGIPNLWKWNRKRLRSTPWMKLCWNVPLPS